MTSETAPVPGLDHDGIPGLRFRDYEALFAKSKSNRKQYPYRWDWHLRMTISALGPTALLYVCTLAIDYFIMTDPDVQDILRDSRIVEKEMRDAPKKVEGLREMVEDRLQSFEVQFKVLKDLIAEMEEKIRQRDEEDKRRQELESKQKTEKKAAEESVVANVVANNNVVASKSVSNPSSEPKNSDAMTCSKKK